MALPGTRFVDIGSRAVRKLPTITGKETGNREALMQERHFTITELSELWNFSYEFTRRLFVDEPGVLVATTRGLTRGKRMNRIVRVPQSVALRVYERMVSR